MFLSDLYKNPLDFVDQYRKNKPFSHIVLDNFIANDLLDNVLEEFPDLSTIKNKVQFANQKEITYYNLVVI